MNNTALYRWNKGFWLFMQALVLPMSAAYLAHAPILTFHNNLLEILFQLVGSFLLILWLIAQALLIMHRFPLKLAPALSLTAGYLLSFLIIWNIEGTPLFAAYTAFFTTLLAMIICGAGLTFQALRDSKPTAKQLLITLTVFVAVLFAVVWFFMPLLYGMDYLPLLNSLAAFVVLGINTIAITRALWKKTIFSKAVDEQVDQYNAEWQSWAAPTIITLILSATAALLIFDILAG